ncbi:peptidase M15 [Paenibacillus yonginensis]|uniref:Peptidase M15 n=1 Tax=Paenibacillus yonginensis TaxID=1462996 RepID=A0A1B1N453_9BACL|nr:M15 family metallopeptidase [Paenibacillus yonginensis]ANS76186.1 peptidase M15 [Paenibacillus yonginensis]
MKSTGFKKGTAAAAVLLLGAVLLTACGGGNDDTASEEPASNGTGILEPATASGNDAATDTEGAAGQSDANTSTPDSDAAANTGSGDSGATDPGVASPDAPGDSGSSEPHQPVVDSGQKDQSVVANPDSVAVLVNKQFGLPENFEPEDLVYPNVPFTFKEKIEKRKMRKVAADALEEMFAGAKKDGIYLAGVSAYRSYERQKVIFENYVKRDGEEKARTYSAYPGYSEHETGLAIDVSGSDGKCAAEDCFGGTPEAEWIAKHAAEYGFILRYPEGKEDITGYKYEPWHIRYVGKDIAKEIADRGITLEEYYNAIPVSK